MYQNQQPISQGYGQQMPDPFSRKPEHIDTACLQCLCGKSSHRAGVWCNTNVDPVTGNALGPNAQFVDTGITFQEGQGISTIVKTIIDGLRKKGIEVTADMWNDFYPPGSFSTATVRIFRYSWQIQCDQKRVNPGA